MNYFSHGRRAKGNDEFSFNIPSDVQEEIEIFTLSFEDVTFTEDDKLRLPFIFE